jgi:predicted dehydrogenase
MGSQVNVALAGIAGYGEQYLEALLSNPHDAPARLVGVADPAAHRCSHLGELQKRRIPIYAELDALLDERSVDLMMIVTPIHLHAAQTCLALEHGANVLCEKPLASSLTDALRIAECERRSRRFVAIGYQWSFSKAVQDLKRDILAGVLGRPIRFKTIVFFPRGMGYFRRNDWAGRLRMPGGEPVLDSPVNNATAHYLHNMLYLLGRTDTGSAMPITVQAELYRANTIENYDTAAMRAMTDQRVELLFYTTHAVAHGLGPVCHFEFENGVVDYDASNGATFVARLRDGTTRNYGLPNLDRQCKLWQCIEASRKGESTVACGVRAALPHTLCVLAAQESPPGIRCFPRSMTSTVATDGDSMICVNGLSAALSDCYRRGILPNEHGSFDWSTPAAIIPAVRLDESPSSGEARPSPRVDVETFVDPVRTAAR